MKILQKNKCRKLKKNWIPIKKMNSKYQKIH